MDIVKSKNKNFGEKKPLISVIVPIYNIAPYIRKCVSSIINQTYKALEIILVDDGSSDGSSEICDELQADDERIFVIHKKNGGLVSARKAGLALSNGIYATYVDGDDWIESNMYEVLVNKIADADMIVCGVKRDYGSCSVCEINKIKDGIYEKDQLEKYIYPKMIYTGNFFERGIQPHVINALFKRELLFENQMQISDEIRVGEDAACFYPSILQARKVVFISSCFYHYQMRANSIMGINDGKEMERYKVLYKYLKLRFGEFVNLYEKLNIQLEYFMIYTLLLKEIEKLQKDDNEIFPFGNIGGQDVLAIYGMGRFGCELVNYIKSNRTNPIALWADENRENDMIARLKEEQYDYVLIAVLLKDISDEIAKKLKNMGITESKIRRIDIKSIDIQRRKIIKFLFNN